MPFEGSYESVRAYFLPGLVGLLQCVATSMGDSLTQLRPTEADLKLAHKWSLRLMDRTKSLKKELLIRWGGRCEGVHTRLSEWRWYILT